MKHNRPIVHFQPNYLAFAGVAWAGVMSLLILVPLNLQWLSEQHKPLGQQYSTGSYVLANAVIVLAFVFLVGEQISTFQIRAEGDFVVQNCIIFRRRFDMRKLAEVRVYVHHIKLVFPEGKLEIHRAYFKTMDDWIAYIDFYKPKETWE